MAKHGVDRYVTNDEYKILILTAYHDVICPKGKGCKERDDHIARLGTNFSTLQRFLDRLSELELEDAISAS